MVLERKEIATATTIKTAICSIVAISSPLSVMSNFDTNNCGKNWPNKSWPANSLPNSAPKLAIRFFFTKIEKKNPPMNRESQNVNLCYGKYQNSNQAPYHPHFHHPQYLHYISSSGISSRQWTKRRIFGILQISKGYEIQNSYENTKKILCTIKLLFAERKSII